MAGAGGDRSPGQTPGWDHQDGQPGDASLTSLGAPGWVPDEPHEAGQRPHLLVREGGDGGPWTPRIHLVARRGSVRAWCRWRHSPGLCEALVSVTGPGAGGGRRGMAGWHHCGCCPSPGVAWPRPWGTALPPRALPSSPGPSPPAQGPFTSCLFRSSVESWSRMPNSTTWGDTGPGAAGHTSWKPGPKSPFFPLLMDQGQHGQQRRGPGRAPTATPHGSGRSDPRVGLSCPGSIPVIFLSVDPPQGSRPHPRPAKEPQSSPERAWGIQRERPEDGRSCPEDLPGRRRGVEPTQGGSVEGRTVTQTPPGRGESVPCLEGMGDAVPAGLPPPWGPQLAGRLGGSVARLGERVRTSGAATLPGGPLSPLQHSGHPDSCSAPHWAGQKGLPQRLGHG